ncbi:Checkpoint serine/threonine-protein kinase BUB1 [Candida viswanathii]|uniref:Checkpoint serine/threonine-protein kinase BUB1 n=1 Tax=Candida viswanathii TaxID=5486 RepID=A0A367Y0L9_9ASCO|nr:Checkpoint serine/threonine-protein kinase BUB1 [Candida viswanathii]
MAVTRHPIHGSAHLVEQQKENIVPLNGGRSVTKLANALPRSSSSSPSKSNHLDHKLKLARQRDILEKKLLEAEDSDDPLLIYVEYLDWIHYNYPQGANTESGLVILLEQCTAKFRDIPNYKNDPRYLKVWMEYINYSDTPKDIFIYLAKKDIGTQLALYYEEFASYLELLKKYVDANQIYELGIQSNAYPLRRLQRSYEAFKERFGLQVDTISTSSEVVREVLALKRGTRVDQHDGELEQRRKRPKLEVFKDGPGDQNGSVLQSIFGAETEESLRLNPIKQRVKENIVSASTWKGQILKQRVVTPPSTSKIPIFRDDFQPAVQTKKLVVTDHTNNRTYTFLETEGKKPEKVFVNMDLVYPDESREYSLIELLAVDRAMQKARRLASTQEIPNSVIGQEDVVGDDDTKTITLALNNTTSEKTRYGQEPTITMNGNIANNELQSIYNDLGQVYNFEDEEEKFPEPTVTNYDGFVTETIQPRMGNTAPGILQNDLVPTQVDSQQIDQIATPPTDVENSFHDHGMSSPFVEEPAFVNTQPIDPFDTDLQDGFLDTLAIPMTAYSGYYDKSSIKVDRIRKFRDITNKNQTINKSSQLAIIDYCGHELYCLLHELGRGGYGFVYLIEEGSTGKLKALKIESPANRWEFYILHQIHRRLVGEPQHKQNYFIRAEALYYFKDESFLVLDYCSQSNLLDVVNNFKNQGSLVDEVLVIFFTVELIKILESLHSINILHGDLKADNCMVRFEPIDDAAWGERYDKRGKSGWNSKGVTLIDLGRAVDMNLFSCDTRFVSHFKADEQDCPQMNEGKPWTYEADYYGLAGIIHTLLFGTYIRVTQTGNKTKLCSSFKRYWQSELWTELFDLLLNPYDENAIEHPPKTHELGRMRQLFEDWLEENAKGKYLKGIIKTVETELNSINRSRVN